MEKTCANCAYADYLAEECEGTCGLQFICLRYEPKMKYWMEKKPDIPKLEYDRQTGTYDLILGANDVQDSEHLYISICDRGVRVSTDKGICTLDVDWSKMRWKPIPRGGP